MGVRIKQFDYYRVIGALAVIGIHVLAPRVNVDAGTMKYMVLTLLQRVCIFAVPLFFFLSGYLLADKGRDRILDFYWRRFSSVVIPYTILFIVLLLRERMAHNVTLNYVVYNYFSANICIHLWFIPILVQLYILHPLLVRLLFSRNKGLAVLAVLLAAHILYILLLMHKGLHVNDGFLPVFFVQGVFYYGLGIYLKRNGLFQSGGRGFGLLSLLLLAAGYLAIALMIVRFTQGGVDSRDFTWVQNSAIRVANIFYSVGVIGLLYPLATALDKRARIGSLAAALAGCTYFVYLWHYPVLGAYTAVWRKLHLLSETSYAYYLSAYVLVTLGIFLAGVVIRRYFRWLGPYVGVR